MDLIIFDDICVMCNRFTQFVIAHDKKDQFRFASQDSQIAKKLGISPALAKETLILVKNFDSSPKLILRSGAVLEIVSTFSIWWKPLWLLIIVPPQIRNVVYRLISNNRYKLWGTTEVCSLEKSDKLLK